MRDTSQLIMYDAHLPLHIEQPLLNFLLLFAGSFTSTFYGSRVGVFSSDGLTRIRQVSEGP